MKKILFALLLWCIRGYAQPAVQWQHCYGGGNLDLGRCVCMTRDGGYIMAGESNSTNGQVTGNHANIDVWIAKTDSLGNLQWQKSYGGTGNDYGLGVIAATGGGYFINAFKYSSDGDATCSGHYWVMHIDDTGAIMWQSCFENSLGIRANGADMMATKDSGLVFVGGAENSYWSGGHGGTDFLLAKLDKNGNLLWHKCYGGSREDQAGSICKDDDGNYYIAGYTKSNDGQVSGFHTTASSFVYYDYWVIKVDSFGGLLWQNCLGGLNEDVAYSIRESHDVEGGIIVAGSSLSNDGDVTDHIGTADFWVVKLGLSGTIQWAKSFGGSLVDMPWSIEPTYDSGYIIGGYTSSYDYDVHGFFESSTYDYNFDGWIVKIDNSGTLEWQKCIGGSYEERFTSVHQTRDSGFIACGYTQSHDGSIFGNHGSTDFLLTKLRNEDRLAVDQTFALPSSTFKVYPNPSSGEVKVVAGHGHNHIQILDLLGNVLLDRNYDTPDMTINLDIPAGIYLVRLNGSETRKLHIMR